MEMIQTDFFFIMEPRKIAVNKINTQAKSKA